MSAPLRRLNPSGHDRFREWLGDGAPGAAPRHLLDDPRTTEPLPAVIPRPERIFASRFELGETLVGLLGPLDTATVRLDVGLWDWLSLHLFDQLCPPKASGGRELRKPGHYALEIEDHQRRHRHLVRSAWTLVRLHGANARFILARSLHTHGEASEQLGAYQDLINCRPLIAALSQLCWDDERQAVKRGFLGQQGGSVRRVPPVMKQFRLTYDIDSMSPDEILGLLPREFDRFRPARPRPQARPADDERLPGMMQRPFRDEAGRM